MSFINVNKISKKEAWNIRWILLGFFAFGLMTIKFYPLDILKLAFPEVFINESSCIMLNVFGIPCPFCGMSHAFYEFLDLNFSKSIYYNPSSVIFFSFLGMISLSIFILSFFNYKLSVKFNKTTLVIFIMLLLTMWILNVKFGHLQ